MKKIYSRWWNNGNKNFQIIDYKDCWKEVGIKPSISFKTNKAYKRKTDTCLDVTLTIGYVSINYINFNFRKNNKTI